MKIQILNIKGGKKAEIETNIFDGEIRQDIIQRVVEAERRKQPYAPLYLAGKQASASGKLRHARRKWKTAAGRGISRVPRKVFWRRGTQFYWQAATIASARGGRRAHPPKILSMTKVKKVNKKEKKKAFLGALALTASVEQVKKKYKSLKDKESKIKFPIIIDDKILDLKTKEFLESLKHILQELSDVAIQKKNIRAGRGKSRGRKYKKTAGLLFVVGKDQDKKIKGIEIKKASQVSVSDLASNGARLTAFTEEAVKDLEEKLIGKKEKAAKKGEKKEKTEEKKISKRKEKKQKRKKLKKKFEEKENKEERK